MAKKIEITNQIRKFRFFAGEMTQQDLAEKAGVSRQTIIAVEAGKYAPSLELAFRIADAFGVAITEVFEYRVKEDNTKKTNKNVIARQNEEEKV
jgi:putative transcriptional regulator